MPPQRQKHRHGLTQWTLSIFIYGSSVLTRNSVKQREHVQSRYSNYYRLLIKQSTSTRTISHLQIRLFYPSTVYIIIDISIKCSNTRYKTAQLDSTDHYHFKQHPHNSRPCTPKYGMLRSVYSSSFQLQSVPHVSTAGSTRFYILGPVL